MSQSTSATVVAAGQRAVVAMLLNPRLVTGIIAAVAVVAGFVLGPDAASAGWSTSPGGR